MEVRHGKKNKDMRIKLSEAMAEKTQFEMEVPTIDTSSSEGTTTYAYNYHLTRDKIRK